MSDDTGSTTSSGGGPGAGGGSGEDKARAALDHLQTAALELISAFRAVLDVAEKAVKDPSGISDFVSTVAGAAQGAASGTRRTSQDEGDDPDGGESRVTRIPVD